MTTLRSVHHVESWVIYQTVNKGVAGGPLCVCEQSEWDEMELLRPGGLHLIRTGIDSEGVAERIARGTSGDQSFYKKKKKKLKPLTS